MNPSVRTEMGSRKGSGAMRAIELQLSKDRAVTLGELLDAWSAHVRRLDDEQSLSEDEKSVWGAYDYYAALLIRSEIHSVMAQLSADVAEAVNAEVATSDDRFRSSTEADDEGVLRNLIQLVFGKHPPDDGWWWFRLPITGPARDDIEAIASSPRGSDLG